MLHVPGVKGFTLSLIFFQITRRSFKTSRNISCTAMITHWIPLVIKHSNRRQLENWWKLSIYRNRTSLQEKLAGKVFRLKLKSLRSEDRAVLWLQVSLPFEYAIVWIRCPLATHQATININQLYEPAISYQGYSSDIVRYSMIFPWIPIYHPSIIFNYHQISSTIIYHLSFITIYYISSAIYHLPSFIVHHLSSII